MGHEVDRPIEDLLVGDGMIDDRGMIGARGDLAELVQDLEDGFVDVTGLGLVAPLGLVEGMGAVDDVFQMLRQIAVRDQPGELVFPPLRTMKEIQARLAPGSRVDPSAHETRDAN